MHGYSLTTIILFIWLIINYLCELWNELRVKSRLITARASWGVLSEAGCYTTSSSEPKMATSWVFGRVRKRSCFENSPIENRVSVLPPNLIVIKCFSWICTAKECFQGKQKTFSPYSVHINPRKLYGTSLCCDRKHGNEADELSTFRVNRG